MQGQSVPYLIKVIEFGLAMPADDAHRSFRQSISPIRPRAEAVSYAERVVCRVWCILH